MQKTIVEPERAINVLAETEVLVAAVKACHENPARLSAE